MATERLDTQVPTEGAVRLVQGMLCRTAIPTFEAPPYRAVYDLIAINPETHKYATIQVKSRFQTDCDRRFIVGRRGADFFAFVFLNMGNWYAGKPDDDIRAPEFYIVPGDEVERLIGSGTKVRRIFIPRAAPSLAKFRDGWHLVADYLDIDAKKVLRGHRSIS
ncbi:MAG: hypothetical protein HYX81_04900 [Chloroflexi bacterium]|nr:hypothetical protein [Chloroflexota bacterium]